MKQDAETPTYHRIVVKLRDDLVFQTDDIDGELRKRQLIDVDTATKRHGKLRFEAHQKDRSRLDELIKRAQRNKSNYVPPSFHSFFVVLVPGDEDPQAVVKTLERHPNVERAYHVPPARGASSMPFGDPWLPNQKHHRPSSENGVDSFCAWKAPGGLGQNVSFVDVEVGGWELAHQDLNDNITPARIKRIGTEDAADAFHGTKVLGTVVGWQNDLCGVGVAPGAKDPRFSSIVRPGYQDTPDTIQRCAAVMAAGDIMLLEIEQPLVVNGDKYPVEVLPDVFNEIQLATAAGIVVIEAAGNSGVDLDTYTNTSGDKPFNPAGPGYAGDSGAIIVGGANSTDLGRSIYTNYGTKIDVFSWADNVMTAFTPPDFSTTVFSGTSAASAIIAGVAVVIQSIRESAALPRWNPSQMRVQLKAPANSIPSLDPPNDRIGRQPDLAKLMRSIGVTPGDVYARDNLADTGLPHGGSLASSPDVLYATAAPGDPQSTWGEGSGLEDTYIGSTIDANDDQHLYVRVRNRGSVDATDVKAKVYWAPPATLVLPGSWNYIGEATLASVPVGDTAHILGPITWSSANIPANGHYCFVALLGADCDPMPDPATIVTMSDYLSFIRDRNNAVWRNFNVITPPPAPPPSPGGGGGGDFAFPFFGAGAPDRAMFMRFDVEARLPRGALLGVEVPPEVSRSLGGIDVDHREVAFMRLGDGSRPRRIAAQGRTKLGGVQVPAGRRIPFVLHVRLPAATDHRGRVSVVQRLKDGTEVGRISWQIERRKG